MFQALFSFIIKLFFWLIGVLGSIIVYPIQLLLVSIFPDLGNFVSTTLTFLEEQIFPKISFIKDVIIYISGLPVELWEIFIGFIVAAWLIAPTYRALKFIYNIWRVWRGTV